MRGMGSIGKEAGMRDMGVVGRLARSETRTARVQVDRYSMAEIAVAVCVALLILLERWM